MDKPIEPKKITNFRCMYLTPETQKQLSVLSKKFGENASKVVSRLITERYASMFIDYSGGI